MSKEAKFVYGLLKLIAHYHEEAPERLGTDSMAMLHKRAIALFGEEE